MIASRADLSNLLVWKDEHGETWFGVRDELGRALAGPLDGYPGLDPRSGFKAFGVRPWLVRCETLVFPKPGQTRVNWPADPADVPIDFTTETRNVYLVRPPWVAFLARRLDRACVAIDRIPDRLRDFERNDELRRALDAAERLGGVDGLAVACATISLPLW